MLEVVKHPDADKLNVCQVDAGTGATLNIVCGAPNVAPGIKVPVALVGAELPPAEEGGKPFAIKLSKLRGVESQGMLCSARELKLSEDHSGLLILPEDTPVGQDIRDTLNLDDTIFEIKLTPNKADCLSVFGIARETAAITGAPLTPVDIRTVRVELDETLPVRIAAPDLCGRFSGRVIRGVNAHAKTPQWMVERLERSGQRSVSALVDISNYVMFELGRPSHVFDLDKIHGGIEVRWGKRGESLKLLNGNTVELDETVGVIADDRHVESLAGIMGGDSTAVTLDTTNIYLEAAFWWPDSIRGRARKYNFSTDAAHRFERGVDYATTVEHVERITQLILEICGGKAGPIDDQAVNLPQRAPVKMRVSRANRIIGVKIDADEIADIFTRLGLPFERDDDAFLVTPPSHRFDIEIEEDLIEEVARIYGFEKIPARPPVATSEMRATNETQRSIHDIRHALAARDYAETVNFSFVDAEWEHDFAGNDNPIRLLNPIASQLSVMRTTLFGSLISVLRHNLNRRADRVRVFEAGRVFLADSSVKAGELTVEGYTQPKRVGALAYGPAVDEQWGVATRAVDFFDVKGDLEALLAPAAARFVKAEHPALHPGRSAHRGRWPRGRLDRRAASAPDAEVRAAARAGDVRNRHGRAHRACAAGTDRRVEIPAGTARYRCRGRSGGRGSGTFRRNEEGAGRRRLPIRSEGCTLRRISCKIKYFRWPCRAREEPCLPRDAAGSGWHATGRGRRSGDPDAGRADGSRRCPPARLRRGPPVGGRLPSQVLV